MDKLRFKRKKATRVPEGDRYFPLNIPGPIPECIEFSFEGVVPEFKKRIGCDYDMNCWPHGIALIINNIKFKVGIENRDGAELDEQNLVKLFKYIGRFIGIAKQIRFVTS